MVNETAGVNHLGVFSVFSMLYGKSLAMFYSFYYWKITAYFDGDHNFIHVLLLLRVTRNYVDLYPVVVRSWE